jgi:hypothetical protein
VLNTEGEGQMELVRLDGGLKSNLSLLALYIMGLAASGRITTDDRAEVEAELKKDLDEMFKGYEEFNAQNAIEVPSNETEAV